MAPDAKHHFITHISGERMPDAGLFTWDMNADLLYADGALAELFGLDPKATERGLPVQSYLDRVHPDDVATLAKQISDAIVAEHPTVQHYRSQKADGSYVQVSAFGRCFRDRDDNPAHYAGIVVPDETSEFAGTTH
ncbi:PAS domain-containing protein [Rhizobium cauense]|uniref:PAS domain-containing protein n=1 Tax=Rhizobium cauense TaxID=1166683 RepID=UPI001C6EE6FF|nr:PAS domain-containing protein [Rhizobium cauense]MBW9114596.1 PAS domain-containing protein [Rhizobium cauense]